MGTTGKIPRQAPPAFSLPQGGDRLLFARSGGRLRSLGPLAIALVLLAGLVVAFWG